jgi:LmbE family N-acetylglucosaminyl deacetylase
MKLLVVAHPDDEILWFNPEEYDKIVIVFGDFGDSRGSDGGNQRRKALEQHPLKDKIVHLNIKESDFTRDKTKESVYRLNQRAIEDELRKFSPETVTTHNGHGEYGHVEHIQLFYACMNAFDCPVNGKNPEIFRKTKKIYEDNGAWTWY